MARVRNKIGSLREIVEQLRLHSVTSIQSLDDIRQFWSTYEKQIEEIKEKHRGILQSEIEKLEKDHTAVVERIQKFVSDRAQVRTTKIDEIEELLKNISPNRILVARILDWMYGWRLKKQLNYFQTKFDGETLGLCLNEMQGADAIQNNVNDKKVNFDAWADKLAEKELYEIRLISSILNLNKSFFYGAEGEAKVVTELLKLPDTYTIINDYGRSFSTPIYDRKNDDRIMSIQIDHIVVGPTGIFLIETKNWSQQSVETSTLFSPIKQILRANFALFVLLNQAINDRVVQGFVSNWGEQKISPKNIVACVSSKPHAEFQYVKVLSIEELNSYITSGKAIFSEEGISSLVQYLSEVSR